jgi:hypothetical protein
MQQWMEYDREELLILLRAATTAMLNRSSNIYIRASFVKDSRGRAFADGVDVAGVDIAPGMTLKQTYEAWLHEVAHHLLGHVDYLSPDSYEGAPELKPTAEGYPAPLNWSAEQWREHDEAPQEIEAERLRKTLDEYAERMARQRFLVGNTKARIWCLTSVRLRSEEME